MLTPDMAYNISLTEINPLFENTTNTTEGGVSSRKGSPVSSAIQFTVGVLGNCMALWVLFRGVRKHKWRIFYRLVAALAATDLFGIVATSPVALAVYDNDLRWVGGQPLCDYLAFMLIFAGLSTIFIVAAMSLDRFVAVCFPYTYNISMQKARVHVLIACVWLAAIFIACLPLLGLGHNVLQFPGTWCFFDFFGTTVQDKVYAYLYACLGIVMITLTLVLNVLVIVSLARNKRQMDIRKTNGTNVAKVKSRRNDVFIMIFLVVLLVIFITCWTPLMVRVIINTAGFSGIDRRSDLIALRMAALNQILDPWVYILFRKEVFIRCIRCGRNYTKPGGIFYRISTRSGSLQSETSSTVIETTEAKERNVKHKSVAAISIPDRSSAFSNSITVVADFIPEMEADV